MRLINDRLSIVGMPSYAFPDVTNKDEITEIMNKLKLELRKAVAEGIFVVQVGMSMGADIWAARAVLELKLELPQIQLHCYLPCETQANQWAEQWRELYFNVLGEADEVFCMQTHYTKGCLQRRRREMLSRSSRVILIYGEKADGAITPTIDFCNKNEIEMIVIRHTSWTSSPKDDSEPIIRIANYISSQTSSAYLAGLDMGMSAIKRAWL